jgi:beta-glucanase (GH16 family)
MLRASFILAYLFSCTCGVSQVMWQFNKDTVITWYYQEGDEFNGAKLNTGYWKYVGSVRSIYTNKEQQYYTDGQNHIIDKGRLLLFAKKETVNKRAVDWLNDNDSLMNDRTFLGLNKHDFKYTAGQIETEEKFVYGYFEIKFKMPDKKGFWPAYWLAGGSPNEEIDMMELKTEKKDQIHVGRHSRKREENYLRRGLVKRAWGDWVKFNGDLTTGYNVIAAEWTPNYINYFLNGEIIAHTEVELPNPKKLIVNIAVPDNDGPFKPGPSDTIKHSGNFEIDYVRIWTTDKVKQSVSKTVIKDTSGSYKINASELRSKTKFIYGKKNLHKNEGLTINIMPLENKGYLLTVLGKEMPTGAGYKVIDKTGKEIASGDLTYGELYLNHGNVIHEIRISAYNRNAVYYCGN